MFRNRFNGLSTSLASQTVETVRALGLPASTALKRRANEIVVVEIIARWDPFQRRPPDNDAWLFRAREVARVTRSRRLLAVRRGHSKRRLRTDQDEWASGFS